MHYFVNMTTGESRWVECADTVETIRDVNGDVWERKGSQCSGGYRMQAETNSPLYEAWFNSEPVQAKLRDPNSGWHIAPKSADINHR